MLLVYTFCCNKNISTLENDNKPLCFINNNNNNNNNNQMAVTSLFVYEMFFDDF